MKNNKSKYFFLVLIIIVLASSLSSCRKEVFYKGNDSVLTFSTDTLTFDTVFTEVGTVTRFFRIQNPLNTSILLERITLKNLNGLNTFRINVDGTPGTSFENVEIPANDFIYVFVEATVDPNNATNPFVILDEIQYEYNNTVQLSYLEAWGQNAYYHRGEIYRGITVDWLNDLPHVVLRDDTFPGVGVDSFSVLNIQSGCEIYVGQGAGVFVDGALNIGQAGNQDSVFFRSNRIETLQNGVDFENNPGLWQGIALFSGSVANIYNTCINQAIWGIQCRHFSEDISDMVDDSGRPTVLLDKVQIKNSALNALIALNTDLTVRNSLFYNSGSNLVAVALGGSAQFDNCTMFNNGVNGSDDSETLILSNIANTSTGNGRNELDAADFTNCIIYGNASEQIILSEDVLFDFNYSFTNCLLQTEISPTSDFTNCIFNQNPDFVSSSSADFRLEDTSPCIGTGFNNGISEDLYFSPRSGFDIGAIAY